MSFGGPTAGPDHARAVDLYTGYIFIINHLGQKRLGKRGPLWRSSTRTASSRKTTSNITASALMASRR